MPYGLKEAISGARTARAHMRDLGVRRRNWHAAVLIDRALSRGLNVSADGNGRALIGDGNRTWWFSSCTTNYNRPMAVKCATHKEVTNALLRSKGLNAPRNAVFASESIESAWAWSEHALPVVLKPSSGTLGGKDVYVGLNDRTEFADAFEKIADTYGSVLVEEFATGVEHRVLTVRHQVVAAVRRVPAYVVGDGFSNVGVLAEERSAARKEIGNPLHGAVTIDGFVLRELQRRGLSIDSVPSLGERVYLRSTSNTHYGGDAVDATDDLTAEEKTFVERASKVFDGLNFAGFDVLLSRDGQGADPCIIEINPNPAVGLHHFPAEGQVRDAAGRLMDAMFAKRPVG